MNECQIGIGPVVFLAKDGGGKELVLEEREGTFEGLTSGAASVCNKTSNKLRKETIRYIYADAV